MFIVNFKAASAVLLALSLGLGIASCSDKDSSLVSGDNSPDDSEVLVETAPHGEAPNGKASSTTLYDFSPSPTTQQLPSFDPHNPRLNPPTELAEISSNSIVKGTTDTVLSLPSDCEQTVHRYGQRFGEPIYEGSDVVCSGEFNWEYSGQVLFVECTLHFTGGAVIKVSTDYLSEPTFLQRGSDGNAQVSWKTRSFKANSSLNKKSCAIKRDVVSPAESSTSRKSFDFSCTRPTRTRSLICRGEFISEQNVIMVRINCQITSEQLLFNRPDAFLTLTNPKTGVRNTVRGFEFSNMQDIDDWQVDCAVTEIIQRPSGPYV